MRSSERWRRKGIPSRGSLLRAPVVAAVAAAALLLITACGGSEATQQKASPTALASVKRISPPAPASPGPGPTANPVTGGFQYTVQPGDTVAALASMFGTTIDDIVSANRLTDPANITVGQSLTIVNATYVPTPSPTPTAAPQNPAGTGFTYPIAGACLPSDDTLMPNAPRAYRSGIHEGVDFYTGQACTDVPEGTPVLAAKPGKVIRADHNFVDMTADELNSVLARSNAQGYTDAKALDLFRGRQVWIDHGGGIVTRYCHLGGIPDGIQVGTQVQAGQAVGFVGESGTPEAVTAPGTEMHLHFEVRIGDSYLGKGLPPDQVRWLYEQVFATP